jgi:hypothetical protein
VNCGGSFSRLGICRSKCSLRVKLFPQYAQKTIAGAVLVGMPGARVPAPVVPHFTGGVGVAVARFDATKQPNRAAIRGIVYTVGGPASEADSDRRRSRGASVRLFDDGDILVGSAVKPGDIKRTQLQGREWIRRRGKGPTNEEGAEADRRDRNSKRSPDSSGIWVRKASVLLWTAGPFQYREYWPDIVYPPGGGDRCCGKLSSSVRAQFTKVWRGQGSGAVHLQREVCSVLVKVGTKVSIGVRRV